MLVEFKVVNYRSIREEQCLSFVASGDKWLEGTHCVATGKTAVPKLLRSAVIYGANASGKTNLIFALMTMQQLVLNSTRLLEPQFREQYTPFLLDVDSRHQATQFEITILLDGVRYQYGFAHDAERVRGEWLLVYQSNKAQRWFEYHYNPETGKNDWEPFSVHFKGEKKGQREIWKANTGTRALFLTQAAQSNSRQLQPLFNWFANDLIVLPARSEFNLIPTLLRLEDPHYKEWVLRLMNAADIHISDIKVEKRKSQQIEFKFEPGKLPELRTFDGDLPDVEFCHKTSDGMEQWFDRRYESYGTLRLLGYAAPLLDAIENGKLIVVDEFDTSLHPSLTRYVLRMLHKPHLSQNGAQLWMTTHDTSLLDPELLRRDQVWFVEKKKDQSTELYGLTEFSPRKDEAIERGYLQGRYGAIPFLSEFLFWGG
ncbi:MAG: ATP-binding protein [Ferrovum myxofaciens]|uniref:AAA family ATPase n=1 Tax=Ferrovum myxofaciens TaxID=416213 RepID=UPI00235398FE|nr:ATP-binding protein [Ferrovum myxofaciens]QKE40317.1 MAG: ATP-binding protein [Ferrovum myxofaciens]